MEVVNFREDLPHLLNRLGLVGRGVEVGVQNGHFSKHMLEYWKGEKLYLVDAWRHFSSGYQDIANVDHNQQLNCLAQTFMSVYGFHDRAVIVRELSADAASLFRDSSLDFVYLDANHAREAVLDDLQAWFPKIKSGGIFCGHDYLDSPFSENSISEMGVKSAVDYWAKNNGIIVNSPTKELFPFWWATLP